MSEAEKMPYRDTRLSASRVLVFAPHPDDEIFGCGGVLALLSDEGSICHIQVCSDGALGGIQQGGLEMIECRKLESQRALVALQVETTATLNFWNFTDRNLSQEPKLPEAIDAALAQFKPDLVFAPSLMEVHPDHLAVAINIFERWQLASDDHSFELCMYEIGRPIETNCLVDISTVITRKRKAMQCFESQLAERDYLSVIEGLNRYRSYTLGSRVIAAEAFFHLPKNSGLRSPRANSSISHLTKLLPASMRHVLAELDD